MENFQGSKNFALGNPEKHAVWRRFQEVLSGRGREAAIFYPDGTVARTFGGLREEAERWSGIFASAGAKVVGIQTGNTPAWPGVLLGAWQAGCTVVPMDLDLTGERRNRVEVLCGMTHRVVRRDGEPVMETAAGVAADRRPAADLLKLTSGSTGDPRAVRFTEAQLMADADHVCESMGIRGGDVNYGVISFAHSYGFSNLVTPLLCRGIPLVAAEDSIPQAIVRGLAASGATVFPGVPAHFRTLAQLTPVPERLRLCISAGARLAADTARSFAERWGRKVHSFYGASECGGICYDAGEEREVPEGYVGAPLKGVTLEPVADESGRIRVRSRAVGLGYWPEDAEELAGGVFHPADLLEKRAEGYVITGRESDLINVAGRKVNPAEVEAVLRRCPGVHDVVVLGLPAPLRGEEVAACVTGSASEETLRRFCGDHLASWQSPRRWIFLEEIPVNARGKVSRADLRRRLGGG